MRRLVIRGGNRARMELHERLQWGLMSFGTLGGHGGLVVVIPQRAGGGTTGNNSCHERYHSHFI